MRKQACAGRFHKVAKAASAQAKRGQQAEPQNYPLASASPPAGRAQRGGSHFGNLDSYEVVESNRLGFGWISETSVAKWDGNMLVDNNPQIRTYNSLGNL